MEPKDAGATRTLHVACHANTHDGVKVLSGDTGRGTDVGGCIDHEGVIDIVGIVVDDLELAARSGRSDSEFCGRRILVNRGVTGGDIGRTCLGEQGQVTSRSVDAVYDRVYSPARLTGVARAPGSLR